MGVGMTHMVKLNRQKYLYLIISISEIDDVPQGSFTVHQVNRPDPGNKNIYDLWALTCFQDIWALGDQYLLRGP